MNTIRATRIALRLGLPLLLLCGLLLYRSYGFLTVPRGMDTMIDTHPPGTVCLIAKHPSEVAVGAVVFVDLPDGSTVLTRVAGVLDGSVAIRHDNRRSAFVHLEERGPYPIAAVRGLVLTKFVTATQGAPRDG